jgi:hypothetical protein
MILKMGASLSNPNKTGPENPEKWLLKFNKSLKSEEKRSELYLIQMSCFNFSVVDAE